MIIKKGYIKKLITRKKEKHDNINTHEKELLNNYEKKGKRKVLNNLDDDKREEVKESDKIRKKNAS